MEEPDGITITDAIGGLLKRLTDARFTGTLTLQLDRGVVYRAELHHLLEHSEFQRVLPTIEPAGQQKKEFRDMEAKA